ncbi:MAG: carboxypeptidase regulatory-like domain-containing protein [Planctomycetes bacterium]|nr:carboxypeptidase regulatory-like domain-containing protein [Planctomycetota bacterium]
MRPLVILVALLAVVAGLYFAFGGGDDAPQEAGLGDATVEERGVAGSRQAELGDRGATNERDAVAPGSGAAPVAVRSPRLGSITLAGRVIFDDDVTPVVDAVVSCVRDGVANDFAVAFTTTTDAQGHFRFEELAARGWFDVACHGTHRVVELDDPKAAELVLRVRREVTVRGVVVDGDGRGVADALVAASRSGDPLDAPPTARTDPEGRFALHGVGGSRWLRASAAGRRMSPSILVEARAGAIAELRLVVAADPARIAGRVVDRHGAGVRDAIVLASTNDAPRWETDLDGRPRRRDVAIAARSDASGAFAIDGLAPGALFVRARADGVGYAELEVPESARRSAELTLTLEPFAQLDGTVHAADGTVPDELAIALRTASRDLGTQWEKVARDGTFVLRDVCPGSMPVQVWQGDRAIWAGDLVLAPGDRRRWDLVLPEASGVAGRVVDMRGAPLAEYTVIVLRDGQWLRSAKTDAEGRFAVDGLDPGPLALRTGRAPRGADARSLAANAASLEVIAPDRQIVLVVGDEQLASAGVRGKVLAPDGTPLGAATIQLSARGSGAVRITSEPDGGFAVDGVTPGEYQVMVRHPAHAPLFHGERMIAAQEQVDFGELRLPPSGRLVVRATSADGVSTDALAIGVLDDAGRQIAVLQAEAGAWVSGPLPLGALTMIVAGQGIARSRHPVTVAAGEPTRVELRVSRGLATSFVATLPPGIATPNWVWISLFGADGTHLGGTSLARSEDRAWRIDAWLAPGRYVAQFGADDQRVKGRTEFDVTIDGATVVATLALER